MLLLIYIHKIRLNEFVYTTNDNQLIGDLLDATKKYVKHYRRGVVGILGCDGDFFISAFSVECNFG